MSQYVSVLSFCGFAAVCVVGSMLQTSDFDLLCLVVFAWFLSDTAAPAHVRPSCLFSNKHIYFFADTTYTLRTLHTVSVQHVADATVTTLTGLRASDLAAALSVVDGSSVAGVSSGAGGVGGAGGVSGAVDSVVVDTEGE